MEHQTLGNVEYDEYDKYDKTYNKELLKEFTTKIIDDLGNENNIMPSINIPAEVYRDKMKDVLTTLKTILEPNHILLRNQYYLFQYEIIISIFTKYIEVINIVLIQLKKDIITLIINRIDFK